MDSTSSVVKTLPSLYDLHDIFFDETSAFAIALENQVFKNSKRCPNAEKL